MPIIRSPEIQKAKSKAELVSRFTAAENGTKEAIGRCKTLEANLTAAFGRIKALERRIATLERAHENAIGRLSDMLDSLNFRLKFLIFIVTVILVGFLIMALKLQGIL